MSVLSKPVFYVDGLMSPAYERVMEGRTDVGLHRLDGRSSPADHEAILQAALGYQIGASRDELPQAWHGTASLLARTPRLLVLSSHGAGYDTIDVEACTRAGVLAVNQAGGNSEAVAEHVLGLMLALAKRIAETDHHMRRQAGIRRIEFMGHDLLGRTVGIVGLGHVGSRVAALCRTLLRMRVLAFDPCLSAEEVAARGAEKGELHEVLRGSHYVSVNCPLTADTRGMIGAAEFAAMPPGAIYINTARGFIHDEAALAEGLRSGHLGGAGLDVWDTEPPPPEHPLLQFDNVLASPHTAGVTVESRNTIARIAAEQMLAVLDGRRPPRLLNPEVWAAYRGRFRDVTGHEAEA